MPMLNLKILKMLKTGDFPQQHLNAARKLKCVLVNEYGLDELTALGRAYRICADWYERFVWSLSGEVPEWRGLAGFRCIADFTIQSDNPKDFLPKLDKNDSIGDDIRDKVRKESTICSNKEAICAYELYFGDEYKENIHSGKLSLNNKQEDRKSVEAEKHFLSKLGGYEPVLGGQAGNILWLWHHIGATAIAYVPYISEYFVNLSGKFQELQDLQVLRFEDNSNDTKKLNEIDPDALINGICPKEAPSGGSVIIVKDGRRLIYQFRGMRVLKMESAQDMKWDEVQFSYKGKTIGTINRDDKEDMTWPSVPLFCECSIEERVLRIKLIEDIDLENAIKGKVDSAAIGGMNAIFSDNWLKKDPELQGRLLAILESQLRVLKRCGISIAVEISGFPEREYADLIKRLCQEDIILALGINGIDELPDTVGKKMLEKNQLYDFWLDPESLPDELCEEAKDPKKQGKHFEYITYRRAMKLAEATGVRTLYVHTMDLDVILRKDADRGALHRAQMADIMGKGMVIEALLDRQYPNGLPEELNKAMIPIISPMTITKLIRFATDFECYTARDSRDRLLNSGCWIAPSHDEYSVAVVPVMWPHITETQESRGNNTKELFGRLNTTGAGDMTFGAFVLLSGL